MVLSNNRLFLLLALAGILAALPADPTLADALTLLQSGDAAGAARILETGHRARAAQRARLAEPGHRISKNE
jgi:hypothetical protein